MRRYDFLTTLTLGCFLALFLVSAVLCFLRRDYVANLHIALFSLTSLLRFGVRSPSIFSVAFPWLDWYMQLRIEYLTVPIMACLLAVVANELLPGIVPKFYRIVVYVTSSAFALIFLFVRVALMPHVMYIAYIYTIFVILYGMVSGIYNIIKNFRKINLEQGILITGFVLILLAILYDFDYYLGFEIVPSYVYQPIIFTMTSVYICFCMGVAVFISNTKAIEAAKAAEQQLASEVASLAHLNQLKTELMATVSHEARTPLAVLASYSGLVAMELKNKSDSKQIIANLDKIVEEAKRVANLIDSMNKLTLNNDEQEDRVNLNLNELIKQTAGLYRHMFERGGIKMNLDIEDELFVFVSPEELTQVLFNLLQNAKDHTEQGSISVIAKREDNDILVIVSDTGVGIAPDLMPNLFERGVSGTKFGMGIGLAICKEVIYAHGGHISIESELSGENTGTRVTFTLPAVNGGGKYGDV